MTKEVGLAGKVNLTMSHTSNLERPAEVVWGGRAFTCHATGQGEAVLTEGCQRGKECTSILLRIV